MLISVSNWSTDEDDVDRSVDAFLRCAWVLATNLRPRRKPA